MSKKINENDNDKILPSKEDVFKTLDFEINHIISEQKIEGWTKWALYGVIAGSLWLLIEQWEKDNFNFNVVLILIVVLSTGLEILRQSDRLLPHRPKTYKRVIRFSSVLPSNSSSFFLYLFRHIVVFIIALIFAKQVFWLFAGIVLIYYGLFSIIAVMVGVSLYFVDTETIKRTKNKVSLKSYYIVWGIILIGLSFGVFGYLNVALKYSQGSSLQANLKIAGLLIVISYSFFLLVDLSKTIPLLSRLIEIRRELSFNKINESTALKQAEIVVAGISVDEKLQQDMTALLPFIEQRNQKLTELFDKLLSLSKEIPKDTKKITREHIEKIDKHILPKLIEMDSYLKKTKEQKKLEMKFRVNVSIVEDESPESAKSAKDFLKKVENSEMELEKKAKEILSNFTIILEEFNNSNVEKIDK